MRRLSFQRWTVILLLLSRLVFGELAHALPHAASGMMEAAVAAQPVHAAQSSEDKSPCAEHQGSAEQQNEGSKHDCCKAGACNCPCMHVQQASLPTFAAGFQRDAGTRPVAEGDGLLRHRTSRLFRPPA